MNISKIGMYSTPITSFKAKPQKNEQEQPQTSPHHQKDEIDCTWGGDYVYKVTPEDLEKIRLMNQKLQEQSSQNVPIIPAHDDTEETETAEEYQNRKINSVEWMM